jgi:hypothetical protein
VSIIYLKKCNDDLVSHCKCESAIAAYPPQMNCPWCGCGWLLTCIECRKAFTFAVAVELDTTWEELAKTDIKKRNHAEVTDEDISDWVASMKEILAGIEVGKSYVCLDGYVIPVDAEGVNIEGWMSKHNFDFVPQVKALEDRSIIDNYLSNSEYWIENELEELE